jgi:two-component system, LuxR family, response regulator DctR
MALSEEMIEVAQVLIVDDDAVVRDAMSWLLKTRQFGSVGFESAQEFLKHDVCTTQPKVPTCILLDVRMPFMSGVTLFETLQKLPWFALMPVIFLSGHANVQTAVEMVKRGALDFFEKPFSDNLLVDRVEQALLVSEFEIKRRAEMVDIQHRINELTERERDVMLLVVEGCSNREVGEKLDISVRTVEVHRSRVFDKMQTKSAVELVNLLKSVSQFVAS